jgi:hypothetical protein
MEYLAFLVPPRARLVEWSFRFDAGHERGNRNRMLAMKTRDSPIGLLNCFFDHGEPRFKLRMRFRKRVDATPNWRLSLVERIIIYVPSYQLFNVVVTLL